jgi:hypothetical protein
MSVVEKAPVFFDTTENSTISEFASHRGHIKLGTPLIEQVRTTLLVPRPAASNFCLWIKVVKIARLDLSSKPGSSYASGETIRSLERKA